MQKESYDVPSRQREREESLVYPADHDAAVLLPVLDIALVTECVSAPPREERDTGDPEREEAGIHESVESRLETEAAVEEGGAC